MIVFYNGKFVEGNEVRISPFDRGFQFADGVYEVMRSYNKKIFKLNEHLARLLYSLREIKIDFKIEAINKIIEELISRNKLEKDFIVYIQVTRGAYKPRMHSFPPQETEPTVYISVYALTYNQQENEKGIKVQLEKDIRWTRCDIKSISLLPAILANQSAKEKGASEAVFVRDGFITEGSHTNFFAVKNNIVYTAPLSNLILSGITREVILEICRNNSIETMETEIAESELKNFSEFFITGTTTEVKPVIQINDWIINNGTPGAVTKNFQFAFKNYTSNF